MDTQFGYERGELPGQPVERLFMPARLRPQGSDHAGSAIRLDDRLVSPVCECVTAKDGTEFPFTMTLTCAMRRTNGLYSVVAVNQK